MAKHGYCAVWTTGRSIHAGRVTETLAVATAGVSSCSLRSSFTKVNINHYKYVTYSIDNFVSLWYAFSRDDR